MAYQHAVDRPRVERPKDQPRGHKQQSSQDLAVTASSFGKSFRAFLEDPSFRQQALWQLRQLKQLRLLSSNSCTTTSDAQKAAGRALLQQLAGCHGHITPDSIRSESENQAPPQAPAALNGAQQPQVAPTMSELCQSSPDAPPASAQRWDAGRGNFLLQQQLLQQMANKSLAGLCVSRAEVLLPEPTNSSAPSQPPGEPQPCFIPSSTAKAHSTINAAGSGLTPDQAQVQHGKGLLLQQKNQPAVAVSCGLQCRAMGSQPHTPCAENVPQAQLQAPAQTLVHPMAQPVATSRALQPQLLLQEQQQQQQQEQQQPTLSRKRSVAGPGHDCCPTPAGHWAPPSLLRPSPAVPGLQQLYSAGLARGLTQRQWSQALGAVSTAAGVSDTQPARPPPPPPATATATTPLSLGSSSQYPIDRVLLAQGHHFTRQGVDLQLPLLPQPSLQQQQQLPANETQHTHLSGPAGDRYPHGGGAGSKRRRLAGKEDGTSGPVLAAVPSATGCAVSAGYDPMGSQAVAAAATTTDLSALAMPAALAPVGLRAADANIMAGSRMGGSTLEQAAQRLAKMTRAELFSLAAKVVGSNAAGAAAATAASARDRGLTNAHLAGSKQVPQLAVSGPMQCMAAANPRPVPGGGALSAAAAFDWEQFYTKPMSPSEAAAAAKAAADAIAAAAAAAAAARVRSSSSIAFNQAVQPGVPPSRTQ